MSFEYCHTHTDTFKCVHCGETCRCMYDSFSDRHTDMHVEEGISTISCRPKNLPKPPRFTATRPRKVLCSRPSADGDTREADLQGQLGVLTFCLQIVMEKYLALHVYLHLCADAATKGFVCSKPPHNQPDGPGCEYAQLAQEAFVQLSTFKSGPLQLEESFVHLDDIAQAFVTEISK